MTSPTSQQTAAEKAIRAEMTERYAAILDDARRLASERKLPNQAVLNASIKAETHERRAVLPRNLELEHLSRVLTELEQEALTQLAGVLRIARLRVPEQPAPVRKPGAPRRLAMRQKPTIVGNMAVEKADADGGMQLTWKPVAAVDEWTVRIEERPDERSNYATVETTSLPGTTATTVVALGERTRRVTLLGRRRDGRVVQRAMISALTADSWRDQWHRKPSAS